MSREEKYKAKQAIDTFCVRAGDLVSAAVVYAGTVILHLGPSQFALVNVALTLVWIGVALAIARPEGASRTVTMPRVARPASAVAATS